MRNGIMLTLAALLSTAAFGQSATTGVVPDANAPKGRLPDAAVPKAYRLDLTILPESDGFSGHDEIDVVLKGRTTKLYLHGRDLAVSKVFARVGKTIIPATFTRSCRPG